MSQIRRGEQALLLRVGNVEVMMPKLESGVIGLRSVDWGVEMAFRTLEKAYVCAFQ